MGSCPRGALNPSRSKYPFLLISDTLRCGLVVKFVNAGDGGSSIMTQTNPMAPIPSATSTHESTTSAMTDIMIARVVEKQDRTKLDTAMPSRFSFDGSLGRGLGCAVRSRTSVCLCEPADSDSTPATSCAG